MTEEWPQKSIEGSPGSEEAHIDGIIESLSVPMERLLGALWENIEQGEYGLIIGDDASGRIPTLLFDQIIKATYQERGYSLPETIFIAGSRFADGDRKAEKEKKIDAYIAHIQNKTGSVGRVLIVTDTIASGQSLIPITKVLQRQGMSFDIATISITRMSLPHEGDKEYALAASSKEFGRVLGGTVYAGGFDIPAIYGAERLSGVFKTPGNLFASRIPEATHSVRRAREDVRMLANQLLAAHRGEK